MSYTYTQQKKKSSKKTNAESFVSEKKESSLPNSAQLANLGHRVDMPTVMREKMEGAFGMDLSGVKLYENKAVGKAGAEAVTQGSKIAFAPGKLDFSSLHGQELLGHEISHVASQAKGEVKGSGLVNDSARAGERFRPGSPCRPGRFQGSPRGERHVRPRRRIRNPIKLLRRLRGRPDAGKKRQEEEEKRESY